MPLAPGLLVRTLARPGGRVTTVVIRRRRDGATSAAARSRVDVVPGKPRSAAVVPARGIPDQPGFSRPVVLAFAALGSRVARLGSDGVALDGRQVPLVRLMVEANRCLRARGEAPIPYPGLRVVEVRR